MSNTENNPTSIQVYDKINVKEYIKILGGVFFSREVILRTDVLKKETVLKIDTLVVPDKIFLNGKEIVI